jgi:kynureninase
MRSPNDPERSGLESTHLEAWRAEFPILEKTTYLISNSLGAMPRGAARGLAAYAETWATRGIRAWEETWWEMAGRIGDAIGEIVGAPPGTVSMHENVTTAEAVVLSCLTPTPGRRKLVCLEYDFPSLLYLYRAHEAAGFSVEVVRGEKDLTMREERVLAAIDSGTLLVALSHVLFRNSYVMHVRPIVERAHAVGALVVLDTYQSAGIIPVDVGALGVDFAVGGCLKWLCGGPGNAFLYTRKDLLPSLKPRFTGWLGHREPFAFDTGEAQPRPDARRMMNGTPAIPAYHAAQAGLDIIRQVGVGNIREKSKQMTARLVEMAEARGFRTTVSRDPERVAGTVAVDVPEGKLVARALKARDFLIDYRVGSGIRVSPHFYNTFEELERLIVEMERIVRTKDYDASQPFASLVT